MSRTTQHPRIAAWILALSLPMAGPALAQSGAAPRLVVQTGHTGAPSATIAPDGRLAASVDWTAGSQGATTLRIWNAAQGRLLCAVSASGPAGRPPENRMGLPGLLAWSADGTRLAALREGGGLLVWDLARCGPAVALTAFGTPSAPVFDQLLTLAGDQVLARAGGRLVLLRPFGATPALTALPDAATAALPAIPPQLPPQARAALEAMQAGMRGNESVVASSADGRAVLLGPVAALPGIASPWQLLVGGQRLALAALPGADRLPAVPMLGAVSADGQHAAVAGPSADGAQLALVDLRTRQVVAAQTLPYRGPLPEPIARLLTASDPVQRATGLQMRAHKLLAGLAFGGNDTLLLLRPRVAGQGAADDPVLEARRLPDLAPGMALALRGRAAPPGLADVQFGSAGNAMASTPDGAAALFVGAGGIGGATLTTVRLAAGALQTQTFGGSVRGIDALQFGRDGLLVSQRLAGAAGTPGASGTRRLVAWSFERGDARTLATEPYVHEDGLAALAPGASAWLRAVDDGSTRTLALLRPDAPQPGAAWTQLPRRGGQADDPVALAFSPDGTRVGILLERAVGAEEAARTAGQAQTQVDQGLQDMQRSAARSMEAMRAISERMRVDMEQASAEMRARLAAARSLAERQQIAAEHGRRLDALQARARDERQALVRQGQAQLGQAQLGVQRQLEDTQRRSAPRWLAVLDAGSGALLASADVRSTASLPVLRFTGERQLALDDGEAFRLDGEGERATLQPLPRLPGRLIGAGARTGRPLIAGTGAGQIAAPEGAFAVTNTAENRIAVTAEGGAVQLLDAADAARPLQRLALPGQHINTMAFSPDDRWLAVGTEQGEVALFDVRNGQLLARGFVQADGGWLVVDAQGRFDTNRLDGGLGVNWVMPDEPLRAYPVELLMRDYYEPRLLPRLLARQAFAPVRPVAELNRAQPDVRIDSIAPDSDAPGSVVVTVSVAATTDYRGRPGGAVDLRLFRNGQLVAEGLQNAGPTGAGRQTLQWRGIRLPAGRGAVQFSAYAFNSDRVKSETVRADHQPQAAPGQAARRPRATIVAIGVNKHDNPAWDLRYAANDARRSAAVLAERLRATGRYGEVVALPLVSDEGAPGQARRDIVAAALGVLAGRPRDSVLDGVPGAERLAAATPDDAVFVLFSGHGVAGSGGAFHLITQTTGSGSGSGSGSGRSIDAALLAGSISSDDLSQWMRPIDAGDIALVIDACYAAAAVETEGYKPGPMGSRGLGQLAYDKGIRILAASQADDVALESDQLQQGLLSYALVGDGIVAGLADHQPADGRIDLREWLAYGMQRVPQLDAQIRAGTPVGRGVKIVQTGAAAAAPRRAAAQQPALFDFVQGRGSPEIATVRR